MPILPPALPLSPSFLPSFRTLCLWLLLAAILPVQGCFGRGNVPVAADSIAAQMDKQLLARFGSVAGSGGLSAEGASSSKLVRSNITIMGTVPVNINNLEVSCPLARQMTEEVSRWLVNAGYKFQELRKGREIYFQAQQGEMLLTRNTKMLATRTVVSQAVLVGTYVVSPDQVRFSMRLVHTPDNEVLAMGTATVPITPDVRPLLVNSGTGPVKVAPTVNTRLQ